MRIKKRLLAVLLAVVVAMVAAACGNGDEPAAEEATPATEAATTTQAPEPTTTTAAPEVTTTTAAPEATATTPSALTEADLIDVGAEPGSGEGIKIGYISLGDSIPFVKLVSDNVREQAEIAGAEFVFCDGEVDPTKSLECARTLGVQEVDVVINFNLFEDAAAEICEAYGNKPTISIDIHQTCETSFFGADNFRAGFMTGASTGLHIQANFDCEYDEFVLLNALAAGQVVIERGDGAVARDGDHEFGLVGGRERGDVEVGASQPGALRPAASGRGPDVSKREGQIDDVFNSGRKAVELPLAGRDVGLVRSGKAIRLYPAPEDAGHAERGKPPADPSPCLRLAVEGPNQHGQHGDPDDIELKFSQVDDGRQQPVLRAAWSDGLGEGADGPSRTLLQGDDVYETLGFFELFVGAQRGDDLDQGVHGGGEVPMRRSGRRRRTERHESLAQGADSLESSLGGGRELLGILGPCGQFADVEFQGAHHVERVGGNREGGFPIRSRRYRDGGGCGLSAGCGEHGCSGGSQERTSRRAAPLWRAHAVAGAGRGLRGAAAGRPGTGRGGACGAERGVVTDGAGSVEQRGERQVSECLGKSDCAEGAEGAADAAERVRAGGAARAAGQRSERSR